MNLTKVFYDGKCGLCSKEINYYKKVHYFKISFKQGKKKKTDDIIHLSTKNCRLMKNKVAIHWFRQDLRIKDNPSLNYLSEKYDNPHYRR